MERTPTNLEVAKGWQLRITEALDVVRSIYAAQIISEFDNSKLLDAIAALKAAAAQCESFVQAKQ